MKSFGLRLNPRSVLRPEPGGALWFQPRSAETLELDAEGLQALSALLEGRRQWSWRSWTFRNHLLARGFIERRSAMPGANLARDQALVRDCLLAARSIQAPLRSRTAPEVLHLSLTDACNQRCGGCFFSNRGGKPNRYLDWDAYTAIVATAARYKVFQLALGGGEPLMHPRLDAMVAHATAAGLLVNLTSSGALLNLARVRALKAAGLGQLQLSLNGSTAEIHAQTRPAFEAVLAAIGHCRAAGMRFGLNVLVTPANLDDLEAILALAAAQGAWSVNVLRPKPSPDQPGWLDTALPDAAANRRLAELLVRWQRRGRFLLTTDTSLTFLRRGKAADLLAAGLGGCSAGRRMLSIGVDGRVSPCSHVPLSDEPGNPGDFMHAWWGSEHLDRFRRLEDTLKGQCADCELKPVCRGCRAIAWQSGDFDAEDAQCPKRLSISR